MTTKKPKKPTKKPKPPRLTSAERVLYCKLVPFAKDLVLSNPPNTDNYGVLNKMQIVWSDVFPKPKSFPIGRIISDSDGRRIMEYKAAAVLQWAFDSRLTQDSPKSIYAARSAALISLTKIEQSLFNIDEKIFAELEKVCENTRASENTDNKEKEVE